MRVNLIEEWATILKDELKADYFQDLWRFLEKEYAEKTIFPEKSKIFNAFNLTPFSDVKVVLLGQDPYHGKGQAHGLCFSVPDNVKLPPSLKNIYKELHADLNHALADSGNLESWAKQGVLLLNAALTVEAKKAGSHQKRGWEVFTDAVIKAISAKKNNLVFILWGNFAQSKLSLIDESKHCVLTAAHPSPFSAYNGFFGCRHFSKTNVYLKEKGIDEINWKLSNGTLWD